MSTPGLSGDALHPSVAAELKETATAIAESADVSLLPAGSNIVADMPCRSAFDSIAWRRGHYPVS